MSPPSSNLEQFDTGNELLVRPDFVTMPLKIASLGSSFAAGNGIPPQTHRWANRSGVNYAQLVAKRVGAQLTDLSASMATLLNVLNEPQSMFGLYTFPPQISELPADADVVLVLGGGNDVGYVTAVMRESVAATYTALRWILGAAQWFTGGDAQKADWPDVNGLADRYGTVLDAIHQRAPKAQVVVVEYLTLFGPEDNATGVTFEAGREEHHRQVAAVVQQATVEAIQGRQEWCTRIPVASLSENHAVGSQEPWVTGLDLVSLWKLSAWHPNAEGHKAVADMIYQVLLEKGLVST